MTGLLYLIPIALGLGLLGLAAFLWSLKTSQFEDLDGAANRILFDDEPPAPETRHTPAQDAPNVTAAETRCANKSD